MDEDRIEIVTPVPAKNRWMQEVKSRLLQSFVVLSIFVYCALIAAVALKSPSGGTDLKTQLDFIQVAGRLLPADLMNPR